MTFNHVKSSSAFAKKEPLFDVSLLEQDAEFNKWLNNQSQSQDIFSNKLIRKSEDGWGKVKNPKSFAPLHKKTSDLLGNQSNSAPNKILPQMSFGNVNESANQQ